MCEFCDSGKDLSNNYNLAACISDKVLKIETMLNYGYAKVQIQIKFCPVCGKELK